MRFPIALFLVALPLSAVQIQRSAVGSAASDQQCSITRPATAFQVQDAQAFFWFIATRVRPGDALKVEWVNPRGEVASSAAYDQLPAAASLCFLTQMPIAGFDAASAPGNWTVRVVANGAVVAQRGFQIVGNPQSVGFEVRKVTRQTGELIVEGPGVGLANRVHLAQYTRTGGWEYIAELFPEAVEPERLTLKYDGAWKPGDYLVVLRTPDGRLSQPSRFQISSGASYRLPLRAGETWVFTQGPHGSTHFGNTSQAYDIAPLNGRCIVAMRSGIAHAFDRGERQCFGCRSYGNYITIDHEDGDYSHYGHLKAGTFLVRSGQRVEQGQPLAIVGNSGYTLGPGGGYHLHVQVTRGFHIASQSVPFRFEEFRGRPGGVVVSSNGSTNADCSRVAGGPVVLPTSTGGVQLNGPQLSGSVSVAEWWNNELTVPEGATELTVRLSWEGAERDLDLHLVSPSRKHFGWFGHVDGYSGQQSNPEEFRIEKPEPGRWRVSVQGMRSTGEAVPFRIQTAMPGGEQRVAKRFGRRG